jgi:hypothetical protein
MTDENSACSPGIAKRVLLWLWNPFIYTAGGPALIAGLIVMFVSGVIAFYGRVHFDGVLDTHVGLAAPWWIFLAEGPINWLCLAGVLWVAGMLISAKGKRFRAIDLFGTQALARWPYLIVALLCLLPGFHRYSQSLQEMARGGSLTLPQAPIGDMVTFWSITVVMLLATIWFVAMAWKAFRISCDVRGGKAVFAFVVGMIVAEVLSKVIILKALAGLV